MDERAPFSLPTRAQNVANELPPALQPDAAHRTAIHKLATELTTSQEVMEPKDAIDYIKDSLPGEEEPTYITRAARFAYTAILGSETIRLQLATDPDEHHPFLATRVTLPKESTAANPFVRLSEDILLGFQLATETYDQNSPERNRTLREYIDWLVNEDDTGKVTRMPARSDTIDEGGEATYELPPFLAFVQKLLDQAKLVDMRDPTDPAYIANPAEIPPIVRRTIMHSTAATHGKKSFTSNILAFIINDHWPTYILAGNDNDLTFLDHQRSRVIARKHPQLPYTLDLGGQTAAARQPPIPRVMCPLHALKPDGSLLSFLDIYMHGLINTAYDRGVFEPGTGNATFS